jgi:hypothetical protein
LFSWNGETPDTERLEYIEHDFADFYARSQGTAPLVLRLSLFVLMYVAPLFIFRPTSLRSLSIENRARALDKLEASPLGPAALAVKAMLCILWFEHEKTQLETHTQTSCLKTGEVSA